MDVLNYNKYNSIHRLLIIKRAKILNCLLIQIQQSRKTLIMTEFYKQDLIYKKYGIINI